jgi:predicted ArsR family transcriptional regulator
MIQDTSRISYHEEKVKGLSERQMKVFDVIARQGPVTDQEIAAALYATDPNFVRPRRFELVREGVVEPDLKRKCKVTGKTSITWRLARRDRAQKEFLL